MPGGAELVRAERRRAALPMAPPGTGTAIIRTSWVGTAAFAITAVLAAIWLRAPFQQLAFVTAMAMFAAGLAVYVLAYAAGVRRSRTHELGIGGWFFLAGSAPGWAQRHLLGSLLAQVAVAVATAAARPFTSLAYGVLAPVLGLACCGWWGAVHGGFATRSSSRRAR
jgi:hypothetical protein